MRSRQAARGAGAALAIAFLLAVVACTPSSAPPQPSTTAAVTPSATLYPTPDKLEKPSLDDLRNAFVPSAASSTPTPAATAGTPVPLPTPIGTAPAGHVRLATLLIGGEHYPVSQFAIGKPDRCDDSHYHSPLTVYSIEAVRRGKPVRGIKDPAPEECGFGRVREVPVQDIDVTTAEFDAYRAALIGQ